MSIQVNDQVLYVKIGNELFLIPQGNPPEVDGVVPFLKLSGEDLFIPGVGTPEVGDYAFFYTNNFQGHQGTKEIIAIASGKAAGLCGWIITDLIEFNQIGDCFKIFDAQNLDGSKVLEKVFRITLPQPLSSPGKIVLSKGCGSTVGVDLEIDGINFDVRDPNNYCSIVLSFFAPGAVGGYSYDIGAFEPPMYSPYIVAKIRLRGLPSPMYGLSNNIGDIYLKWIDE